jgi:hypothetical protein
MHTVIVALPLPRVHTLVNFECINVSTPTCDRVGRPSESVGPASQHDLEYFREASQPSNPAMLKEESTSTISSVRATERLDDLIAAERPVHTHPDEPL